MFKITAILVVGLVLEFVFILVVDAAEVVMLLPRCVCCCCSICAADHGNGGGVLTDHGCHGTCENACGVGG